MPRPLRWPQLIPGLLISCAILAATIAIFAFARVGGVHGDTVRLYVAGSAAGGVMKGTEVWLDGQKVGVVDAIRFRDPSADTSARVVVTVDVESAALSRLRRDSRAAIGPGGTLIGTPVVQIRSGTSPAAPLAAGDTIPAEEGAGLDELGTTSQTAARDLPAILAAARSALAAMRDARGTAGALLRDGTPALSETRDQASRLMARVTRGHAATTLRDGGLRARLVGITAGIDSVRRLLADSAGSDLGRFRRDSTLLRQVAALSAELDSAHALAARPHGTVGRLAADSALAHQMAALHTELAALIADVKRRPLRYVGF